MTKKWIKALESSEELKEGRVLSVTCGRKTLCLTHYNGKFAALDNACPHQGGPLGEGSIENGYLRCPWHGWDFDPLTGRSPGEYDDGVATYPLQVRDDGIFVEIDEEDQYVPTVSDLMCETMVNWGVKHVWGMVGHSNLGLADAIRRQTEKKKITYYGIRHEASASFACSAYGKLTGRPAACLAIAGPGSTNLLTGLWDAHVDRSPVLALSGQVETQFMGPGRFQEIDLKEAFGGVPFFSQHVLPESKHAELMNLALKTAILERGVSHLIFPDEVQRHPIADQGGNAGSPQGRLCSLDIRPPQQSLEKAIQLLQAAKRPVMILGHGARFHRNTLLTLAEKISAPILTTFKGKGVVGDHHPLACGVLGRSGTPIASWFMNEADCLLVFGASFSDHTGITTKKPIIQIDYDPMILGKFHAVEVPVWGEIGETARLLYEALTVASGVEKANPRGEISERWDIWRREKANRVGDSHSGGISSAALFEALNQTAPENAIFPVDVGNNTYAFGRYFETKDHAVLMSGYLGSIGFALPAAFGAWAATQERDTPFFARKVISISGDGGLGQYLADLTTPIKYEMNITHIVMHNRELGKISKEQRAAQLDVWQTSLLNPSFAELVEKCGGLGIRVTEAADLVTSFEKAFAHSHFSLVEVMTDALLT